MPKSTTVSSDVLAEPHGRHSGSHVRGRASTCFRFVRMLDLAMSTEAGRVSALCLVAPHPRQEEVRAQLNRPKFARVGPT
jgi:hypothetical protein